MSTPIYEIPEPAYIPQQHYQTEQTSPTNTRSQLSRPLSQDGTWVGDNGSQSMYPNVELTRKGELLDFQQPGYTDAQVREMNERLEDDLQLLKAERIASNTSSSTVTGGKKEKRSAGFSNLTTIHSEKSRGAHSSMGVGGEDDDFMGNDGGKQKGVFAPVEDPSNTAAKIFKKIHQSSFLVRYFFYITPLSLVILLPLLLGAFLFKKASVGGVKLMWFSIWLMIVWLSLWAARIIAKMLVYPVGLLASFFTNSSKKWRDMAKMLEVPCTLFFWALAVFISFLPTMTNHHIDGNTLERKWEETANKVWIACLVAMAMNFLEKIVIQLIAISFHERTYEDRIVLNRFQIQSLAKLYQHINDLRIEDEDKAKSTNGTGDRTPLAYLRGAKDGIQSAVNKASDILGKAAGDFTGKNVQSSTEPYQVILQILSDRETMTSFGRRIFRCFAKGGDEQKEFPAQDIAVLFSEEEGDAVLSMFDKDLSGDISQDEIQNALSEVGHERKSIMASLKDLDSVVSKLDNVLTFLVLILTTLVFVAILSNSTTTILASTGSTLLAISWLFSQTAQEFLASIIFVFVKHPFDVGDRVEILVNNTLSSFYVKEIALMYTELKRMEGHIVQAPNSLLNTLFILNARRSPALAEGIPITIKFGSTIEQIDELRNRMLDFVKSEKKDYEPKIFTEVKDIKYLHEVTLNVVFFYKSNWQNELLRLQRRNKFLCALMLNIAEIGIESPHRRWPGQTSETPIYLQGAMQGAPAIFTSSQTDDLREQLLNERAAAPAPAAGVFPSTPSLAVPVSPQAPASPVMSPLSPSGTSNFWRKEHGASKLGRSDSVLAQAKKFDLSLGANDSSLQYGDAFLSEKKIPGLQVSRHRGDSVGQNSLERTTSRTSQSTTESRNVNGSLRRRDRFFPGRNQMSAGVPEIDNTEDDLETGLRPPHTTPVEADPPGVQRRTTTGQFRTARPHGNGNIRPI